MAAFLNGLKFGKGMSKAVLCQFTNACYCPQNVIGIRNTIVFDVVSIESLISEIIFVIRRYFDSGMGR